MGMLRDGRSVLRVLQKVSPYRYMLAIGTIPFLVYAAVPMKPRVKEAPSVSQTMRFVERWPTSPLVEHVRVRTIAIRKPEPVIEIANDDAIVESEVPPKKISIRRRVDICARHNRRKVVYYVRGYKHWRCRR